MGAMLVATTESLPGFRVLAVLGGVVGVTARSHNPFNEGVKQLTGKSNPNLPVSLLRWREDAIEKMIIAARERGANAIIGMRFDNRQITTAMSEICAYGTAVTVGAVEPGIELARVVPLVEELPTGRHARIEPTAVRHRPSPYPPAPGSQPPDLN